MIIFITGPSASGKSTLRDFYCKKKSVVKISAYTTRPKRIGEKEIHHSVSDDIFNTLESKGLLCLVAHNHGYQYGYLIDEITKNNEFKMFEVDSVTAIKEKEILNATIVRIVPLNKYSALLKIMFKRDGVADRIRDLFYQTNNKFLQERARSGDIVFRNDYSENMFNEFSKLIDSLRGAFVSG